MKRRASQSAHPRESVDYDKGTVYGAEYWLPCVGNEDGTLEYLLQYDNTQPQTSLKTVEHIVNIG
jgi:hypothetical protein